MTDGNTPTLKENKNSINPLINKLKVNKSFWTGLLVGLLIAVVSSVSVFSYQQNRMNKVIGKLEAELNKSLRLPDETYERNLKMMEETQKAKKMGQQFSLVDARNDLADTTEWLEKTVINRKQYAEGEPKDYSFTFKYPNDWSLEEEVDERGCGFYKIAKKQVGQLQISVECGSWAATYYPIPADSVIVKRAEDVTNDGSMLYVIRFMADSSQTYRYTEVLVYPPDRKIDTSKDKMQDKMFFTAPILLDVELQPNGYGSDMETALLIVDTVVNSFSL